MCTLTIIPWRGDPSSKVGEAHRAGVRVMCNRDESRLRPPALPPQVRPFGRHQAIFPIDPVSDGTWIAASDAGLVLVLMNVYDTPIDPALVAHAAISARGSVSRGTIIPHLLACDNLREALVAMREMDTSVFEPFRVVMSDGDQVAETVWSHGRWTARDPARIERPLFFASSGLGDQLVRAPRQELFDESFSQSNDWPARQDAFHRHVWPGNERASVWMTRPEAMTVSCTQVEIAADRVTMLYFARIGDGSRVVEAERLTLAMMTQ